MAGSPIQLSPSRPLRLVFCGTPAFAVPALRVLAAQPDFNIEAVIAQPDRPSGRAGQMIPSPVKSAAGELGLPIFQPAKIKSEEGFEFIQRIAPDAVIIIAYGQIISARLIAIPRLGWINVHASLLPQYRGAAPINWAIANGEARTGLTTMQIDPGLDTGPMLLKRALEIAPGETAPQLTARLADLGAPLIVDTLRQLAAGTLPTVPQDHSRATLAPILKKEDGRIDWQLPANAIYNRIRGFDPWPGAFTTFRGKSANLWGHPAANASASAIPESAAPPPQSSSSASGSVSPSSPAQAHATPGEIFAQGKQLFAACGDGSALQLDFVQLEGRKRVTAAEFANGARIHPAERFV